MNRYIVEQRCLLETYFWLPSQHTCTSYFTAAAPPGELPVSYFRILNLCGEFTFNCRKPSSKLRTHFFLFLAVSEPPFPLSKNFREIQSSHSKNILFYKLRVLCWRNLKKYSEGKLWRQGCNYEQNYFWTTRDCLLAHSTRALSSCQFFYLHFLHKTKSPKNDMIMQEPWRTIFLILFACWELSYFVNAVGNSSTMTRKDRNICYHYWTFQGLRRLQDWSDCFATES